MNTLVLFGSPHENGYTKLLLDYFLSFAPKSKIYKVDSYKAKISPCIGCEGCKKTGICIFRDMDEINFLINSSDVIIIAFPIYNASVPSPLKSVLDRFQPFYFSRKKNIIKNKKVVILTSQGSNSIDYSQIIVAQIVPAIKIIGGNFCGMLSLKGTDDENFDIDKFYIKSKNNIKHMISNLYNIN